MVGPANRKEMMNLPHALLSIAQALGWTVVHSVWQIGLVYLAHKCLTLIFIRHNRLCYALGLIAMAAIVTWASATWLNEYQRLSPEIQNPAVSATPTPASPVNPSSGMVADAHPLPGPTLDALASAWLQEWSAVIGWLWCAGMFWMCLRLLGGYWLAQRLKHRGVVEPEEDLIEKCRQWSARLGIRQQVQLLESRYVKEPMTLGFWKPVVLFPAGMLLQLEPEQLEVLLVHELSHIRRHDYLVNLIQLTLEACFFYHPMFWLLSRDIRVCREYCCDDIVVAESGNRLIYAHILTEIQLNTFHPQNAFIMAATSQKSFTSRILRIAGVTPKRSNRINLFLFVFLGGFTLLSVLWPVNSTASSDPDLTSFASISKGGPSLKLDTTPPKTVPRAKATGTGVSNGKGSASGVGQSAGSPTVSVSATKMNVLYAFIDNPLEVAVADVPASEIHLRINDPGAEVTGSNGHFIARVNFPGAVKLEVFKVENGKEVVLEDKMYRVKKIPDPVPYFSGHKNRGAYTLEELLKDPTLKVMMENFDFDVSFEIVSYQVTVLPKGMDPLTQDYNGKVFPPDMVEAIKKLTPGGSFFIDNIQVKGPGDQSPRNLGGLSFKIKD
jgi:beta-lactamase regulating signal transducer with metallopeptidase domain